jgi:hypothetical protein
MADLLRQLAVATQGVTTVEKVLERIVSLRLDLASKEESIADLLRQLAAVQES